MKVMHLLQSTKYSGAENVVCQIIKLVGEADPSIEMVYVSPKGPIEDVLKRKNIKYYMLDKFEQNEIDNAVKIISPDIIHAHDFNASIKASKYKNVISHIHNNAKWLSKFDLRTIVYALCSIKFKKVIGVSRSILEEFLFKKMISDKFILLQNIVDKDSVIKKANVEIPELFDILYVGRLAEAKNPLRFLMIVKKIIETKPDISIYMLGQGPLENECRAFINTYKMGSNVKMIGFNENPYAFMKAAKVLIMPSVYEGFGLVAVESMILGTPVICTPVGGLIDIVDNTCGVICNTDEEFVKAGCTLLKDEKTRYKMAEESISKAQKFCDARGYTDSLLKIYRSII